jgi:flagellar biosynthesis protein FlhF
MDYVTVRGKDLQDCLMQMKMKYGQEAHVYEHKVLTEGGLFGTGLLANKMYEITVAIPEKVSSKDRVEKKLNDLRELLKNKSTRTVSEPALAGARPTHSSRRAIQELPEFSKWEEESIPELPISEEDDLYSDEKGLSFVQELISKDHERNLPSKQIATPQIPTHQANPSSLSLQKLKDKLEKEGMSKAYLESFISQVDMHLSSVDKGRLAAVYEKAAEILEDRIKVDSDLFSGTKKGKRKVIFIIGPTGAGKTTTIAKLAAKYFLHMGKTVSLYTTDNYRIAAVEQLKRYADTMDLPFCAVKDVKKFREALHRDGSELVLVDTAGYSHKDHETLLKMKEFTEGLGDSDQLENILLIPATVSYHNAAEVMRAYDELGYNRVILSKIDESDYLGSFLELADTNSKEFAYFSVGQDVPFDILGAEKKLLAECVIYPERMKGIKGEIFSKKS